MYRFFLLTVVGFCFMESHLCGPGRICLFFAGYPKLAKRVAGHGSVCGHNDKTQAKKYFFRLSHLSIIF